MVHAHKLSLKKTTLTVLVFLAITACKKHDTVSPSTPTSTPTPTSPFPSPYAQVVDLTIDESSAGFVIPDNFQGLSYETGIMAYSSYFLNPSNSVLVQLLKNLGPGVLRLGGNSSDNYKWAGTARLKDSPKSFLYTTDVDNMVSFSQACGWPVLYGLNLGANDPAMAASQAQYVSNSLQGNLLAYHIGNEADLFYNNGQRSASFTYADFRPQWEATYKAVKNAVPNATFAGPDVSYVKSWVTNFANDEHQNIVLLDSHFYQTGPASDLSITPQTIFKVGARDATYFQNLNSSGKQYNLPYRLSECNSVYNGGKKGVSDVFASAIWGLDFMWRVASNNGSGVNFHGDANSTYSPIISAKGKTVAQPLYYAFLAFKNGSQKASLLSTVLSPRNANCTAYASKSSTATLVTLINKDSTNITFRLQPSIQAKNIQLARLTAPSDTSRTGIVFSGASVAADGTFTPVSKESYVVSTGQFTVNVPAYSAAVVTIQ